MTPAPQLDPEISAYLGRNGDVARRLANMEAGDRDAAFKRIRRWIDDQQSKPAQGEARGFFESSPLKEFLA